MPMSATAGYSSSMLIQGKYKNNIANLKVADEN